MFLFKGFANSLRRSLLMSLCFVAFGIGNALTATAASNVPAIESAVAAFKTIGTLRREFPIDADAITAAYTGALQTLAQEVDTANGLGLDSSVLAAIEEIKDDNEPILAAQVIDKSLQHVFFQTILDRITAVRDDFDTGATASLIAQWDEAAAAFEAIKGTAARENKVISADRQSIETGSNPGLDVLIAAALVNGKTALNKANPAEDKITVALERQVIRIALARTYYIGVLREVEGIISNLDDVEGAREAQKEGEIFYRLIESFVARDNPLGNLLIKAQLTGNIAEVNADQIVSEMNKGFIGRVKSELTANESSAGSDRGRAMEVAEEALLYANVFLEDLEVRMNAAMRTNMENALNSLKEASDAGNATAAATARATITALLADYENELELAQYNKTHDTAVILDGAVAAFKEIGVLRRQFPVDADAILAQYSGDLQQLTQIVDQLYGSAIDPVILAAIGFIRNEDQVLLAAQAIDKSLQRVFALAIYNRVTLVTDQFDDMSTDELTLEWDRAYAAYQAVIGTAARENKVLTADKQTIQSGSNPDIDDQITLAFVQGRQALNKENADDHTQAAIARERIVIPLVRSFLIGVLREVEGIISDRDADVAEAREKQIEGEYFYNIVEGFISQDNPSGNSRIKAQLTGDMANVVADEIVSDISRGLIGQINRSLEQIEAAFAADRHQAMIAAERTSLYVGIVLPDLELRSGSLQRVKMENALQDLKEASETSNSSKAIEARSAIVEVISAYQNELI